MVDFVYKVSDVLVRSGISLPTLQRWLRHGDFPQPVRGKHSMPVWPSSIIEDWERGMRRRAVDF